MKFYFNLSFCLFILFSLSSCEEQITYKAGERLYKKNCSNCHLDDGKGVGALIPPLAGADFLSTHRLELPCIVRNGLNGDTIWVNGQMYAEKMPAAHHLSEADITNILNYVQTAWGNRYAPFRLDEVLPVLEKCPKRVGK